VGSVIAASTTNGEALVEVARHKISSIPEQINVHIHDPLGACAIVLALLIDDKKDIADIQLGLIRDTNIAGMEQQCRLIKTEIEALNIDLRWTLLELILQTLRTISNSQYQTIKQTLTKLIKADKKIAMFEWCVFQIFRYYLASTFEQKKLRKTKSTYKDDAVESYVTVLSCLAYYASNDQKIIERAFYRGTNTAGYYNVSLLARSGCSIEYFGDACGKLANCYPLVKAKLLKGLVDCVKHDGIINSQEQQIIKAIAAAIDSPLPSLKL
jgi:hypothetical protein